MILVRMMRMMNIMVVMMKINDDDINNYNDDSIDNFNDANHTFYIVFYL